MLVQLSPYQIVKTSLQLSTKSRRRKRNETDVGELPPVEASFITTSSTRSQTKWKQHSAEFSELRPILLVSTDHQISAIGRTKYYSYEEFSSLQYSSRPGNLGSFAPPSNGKKSSHLPRIPAILDAKNEHVYALQHGNTRLCCWDPLNANGPDEKHAIRVDLVNPAVSLSLLPIHRGVVYGSCIDGSIFIARVENGGSDGDILAVEYLPSKLKGSECHAGTTAELPDGYLMGRGRKRKMSDGDGRTNVNVNQTFFDGTSLHLVRHEIQFERPPAGKSMLATGSLKQLHAQIPMVAGSDDVIASAKLHITTSGPSPTTSVMYQVKKKTNRDCDGLWYAVMLSFTTGGLAHNSVQLPSGVRQGGMISETIVVVTDQESLYLYDLETGSLLHTVSVPWEVGDCDDWLLRADSKFGTVVALRESNGVVNCCISSLVLDGSQEVLPTARLSLSSKLASSVVDQDDRATHADALVMSNMLEIHAPDDVMPEIQALEVLVKRLLDSLEAARLKTISTTEDDVEDFLFMNTYNGAVLTILTALKEDKHSRDAKHGHHNPQDDLHLNGHGKKNGASHMLKNGEKNGVKGAQEQPMTLTRAFTPSILPQAFIDGATQIVLRLLRSGPIGDRTLAKRVALARLDARLILSRLLQTGKISARHHFDGTESIQPSKLEHCLTSVLRSVKLTDKRGRRCFTPVDMIVTMLQKCPDVSERQMAVMLNYMMNRALPEDIAEIFIEDRRSFLSHRYVALSRKYFRTRTSLAKAAGPSHTGMLQSPELEKLGRRLILAGTSYVLYRIVCYSQCNEAMLGLALQDVIGKRQALILARLLTNILASRKSRDIVSKFPPSANAVKSICQWVAALCDSFHEELSTISVEGGKSYLSTLLSAISLTTKHSQEIISLEEHLRRVELEIRLEREAKNAPMTARPQPYQEDLPGYSVEEVVF